LSKKSLKNKLKFGTPDLLSLRDANKNRKIPILLATGGRFVCGQSPPVLIKQLVLIGVGAGTCAWRGCKIKYKKQNKELDVICGSVDAIHRRRFSN
jgi:hypothetical protein